MSRKQGPRSAGMRPSAIAASPRHTKRGNPLNRKEETL
jgi:hypothetical protein